MKSKEEQVEDIMKSFSFGGSLTPVSADYAVKLEIATAVVDIRNAGLDCKVIMTPNDNSTITLKGLITTDSQGKNTHYHIDNYDSFEAIALEVVSGVTANLKVKQEV